MIVKDQNENIVCVVQYFDEIKMKEDFLPKIMKKCNMHHLNTKKIQKFKDTFII